MSVNSARRDRTGEFPGGTTLPVPSRQMSSPSVGRLAHASGLWGSGAVSLQSRNHVALRMALPIITTPQSDVESTGDHRPARQDARVAGLRIQVLCQRAFSRSGEDNGFLPRPSTRGVKQCNAPGQGHVPTQILVVDVPGVQVVLGWFLDKRPKVPSKEVEHPFRSFDE